MRILADQNVEAPIVARLRQAGHDVLQLADVLPARARDDEVLAHATGEGLVLLTNDKDFGELAFLQRKAAAGVVLLRMPSLDSTRKAQRLEMALRKVGEHQIVGAMVVVSERAIRRRALPDLGAGEP